MFFSRLSVLFVASAVLAGTPLMQAQTRQPMSTAPAAMTNDDVIALVGAGLPDDVVAAKISAAQKTNFDTSVTGLKALKTAGVSTTVIKMMINPTASASTAAPAGTTATGSPDDPLAPHAPGIYIVNKSSDGAQHLVKLEHVVPKQSKGSGAYLSGLTYGITKAKVRSVIDGPKAAFEGSDPNPAFYIYIPEDNASFGGTAINIKDFSLVKFEVKGDKRQIVVGSGSIWGTSAGTDAKALQGFESNQVKPGIYKLTLTKPLPSGEYAFQQSGASGSSDDQKNTGSYFDFGILPQS